MPQEKLGEYTQNLYDTVISLRVEVDNLRTAYVIVNQRFNEVTALVNKNNQDSLKDASEIEKLSRLALVASTLAYDTAITTDDLGVIKSTHRAVLAVNEVYRAAVVDAISLARKHKDGGPK